MSLSINVTDLNATIQRALGAGRVPGSPVLSNRRCRRAMRKRRRAVIRPLVATPRLGATPRGSATRREAGTPRTRRPEARTPGAGMPAQPTFTPLPSKLAFGPPTDISMGWDGTLWAIDASGAPHLYDPTTNAWQLHGDGIDAAAWVGTTYYFFRGSQVVTAEYYQKTGTPQPIAALFPKLPDSFKLGVTAAANIGGTLYLVKGGWYLPAAKLTDLKGWPQTPNWVDGVIDATSSDGGTVCNVIRGGEYITVDFAAKAVTSGPAPVGSFPAWQGHLPADWASSGFDAAFTQSLNNTTVYTFFKGSAMLEFRPSDTGTATQKYLGARYPNWPATWDPVLNHAPSGRMGNLWVSADGGRVLRHDGDTWNVTPGVGPSAAVGQDGSVFLIGTDGGLFQWNGTQFNPQGDLSPLAQVSVGDGNHVWVRDGGNTVHRYQGNNAFSPVDLGAGVPNPTHIAANNDGTLWHCNSSNANIFRLISESTNPSDTITVKGGVVTSVQKVASTGFGAAHCLVTQNGQPQLYRYDSPYVFKTSETYKVAMSTIGSFAQGLGNLYFVQFVSEAGQNQLTVRIVALDAHTGREVANYAPSGTTSQYSEVVFDAVNELVYVGRAPFAYADNSTPGQVIALDARTLAMKWTFTTPGGIDATPALNGTTLCFGDRTGVVYCLDTKQALAAVAQNQPIPTRWTAPLDTNGSVHRVSTPLFTGDQLIATMWDLESDPGEGLSLLTTASIRLSDGNRTGQDMPWATVPRNEIETRLILQPPGLGQLIFPGFTTPSRALFVCAATKVVAWNLDNLQQNQQIEFPLPGGSIATCLIYDDGTRVGTSLSKPDPSSTRLWFGDNQGNLWSLDNQLKPADGTPSLIKQKTEVYTTPVLYKDPQGGLTVLYGIFDPSGALPPSLYGYDPDNRNHASLPTGVTSISTLSSYVTNGVIYAGGSALSETGGNPVQVFGIRVDTLPQALRDFVIESQMMQDPDETAPGGDLSKGSTDPIPPSRARYQTHLTVVDDQKTPQPHEPIKIWADTPMTLMIDGQPFDVGPGDAAYAAVKTGVDGSLVIISGYAKSDGSDSPDMYAPALRVWAGFMDTYERIVVNPDHEFHGRVTTAHANANDDDPDKANLVTTKSYAGLKGAKPTALFTPDEQKADQPKNCASAVSQMKSGVDFGGASHSAKTLFNRLMLHTSGRKSAQRALRAGKSNSAAATASPPKYVAYTDLAGSGYFPANIPAPRPMTVAQPTGLIFSKPKDQPTTATTLSIVHHADAQMAIDALPPATVNPPWLQPSSIGSQHERGVLVAQRLGENIFETFWKWLKHAFAEITDLIVTIADEVMVGIRMIVNGVEQIFKAIVKVVDDIAAAIGSFFKMLVKAIEDVIAALSVLFHFGEIIHTHKWIRDQINANLQQAVTAMQTQVKPSVDRFFQQGEQAIKDLFDEIRNKLGINDATQINTVNSARSTPHTAFTAGPGAVGPDSGGSSHAVQCMHTTQKMKTGLPSAQPGLSGPSPSKNAPTLDDDDGALSTFLTNFVNSLQNDPTISTAFTNLKSAINKIGQSRSAGDFFKSALNLLLTIVEDLILGMVAVTQALVDGLIGAIQALVNTVVGLLNTPVNIPFISWLYQSIVGEPLTMLNAVSLVAAIPVTMIYRVVEGRYPSQDGITGSTVGLEMTRTTATPDVLKIMQGCIGGCIALGLGIARAVVDFIVLPPGVDEPSPTLRIGAILVLVFSVAYVSTFFPLMVPGPTPTAEAWAAWGLGLALALLGTFGVIDLRACGKPVVDFFKKVLALLRAGLAIARFIVFIVVFAKSSDRNAVTDVQFARNLFLELPPMFNWLKLERAPANEVLAAIDLVTGVVVCVLDITAAFLNTEPDPHMPRPIMA